MKQTKIKQAIILLSNNDQKMFPFNNIELSTIPIGNIKNIELIIKKLKALSIEDVKIVGEDFIQERNILRNYTNVEFIHSNNDLGVTLGNLVESGDTLIHHISSYVSKSDLNQLIEKNINNSSVLLEKNAFNTFSYKDYICAYANDFVDRFYAHPRSSYVNSRSAGVYLIKKEDSRYLKTNGNNFNSVNVGVIKKEGFYIEQSLNDALDDGKKIYSVFCEDPFVHLKYAWDILEANYHETCSLENEIVVGDNTKIDDSVIFEGRAKIGRNCKLLNGAIIGDSVIIGDDCIITNYGKISSNTVIGNKNKIGYTSEVSGVTFDNVAIVHNSHISSLIGSNVDIGAGTNTANLRFDDLNQPIKVDGRVYSNKYTNFSFIGESTRTGVGALLSPGVRIGRNSAIGSGVLVNNDVEENSIVILKQEHILKEWGEKKHGW